MEMAANGTRTKEASELLHSVLDHLNILTTTGVNFPLSTFKIEVQSTALESSKTIKRLVLDKSINAEDWNKLEEYINAFNNDYDKRVALLKKRVEASLDSFLWSERVKKFEPQIRAICESSDFSRVNFQSINSDHLLTADSDLLAITKTASEDLRQKTKNKMCDFKLRADVVPDRGGRTEQMKPLNRESFQQQEVQRSQPGRGGGNFNRNGRNQERDRGKGSYQGPGRGGHGQQRGKHDDSGKRGRYY